MSLAKTLARAVDPVALAEAVGIDPDPAQTLALRSDAERSLWLCCRQWGKSTTASILGLGEALYNPESTTLLISPSQRQSSELFKKVTAAYRVLGRPVPSDEENRLSLTLENGSRVISLPGTGDTIRGYTADLLVIDEASRVEDGLYASVRPMLAVSGGRLIALTTPHGKRGWFHEEWTDETRSWERVKVTAADCPRISPTFLAEERRSLGEWLYAQEYECEFVETEDAVFRQSDIDRAADPSVQLLDL